METPNYTNNSDYQFLTNYTSNAGVPILKPNFIAPNVVAQVRRAQMTKMATAAPPVYASYNTLTGGYCSKPQDPSSAYQGLNCAYAPHTVPYQATAQIQPYNSFGKQLARAQMNSQGQPMPQWYEVNSM